MFILLITTEGFFVHCYDRNDGVTFQDRKVYKNSAAAILNGFPT